jgi:hypothetical protein
MQKSILGQCGRTYYATTGSGSSLRVPVRPMHAAIGIATKRVLLSIRKATAVEISDDTDDVSLDIGQEPITFA